MKIFISIIVIIINFSFSQGAWMFSNRTHPELTWETIKLKTLTSIIIVKSMT